MLSSPIMIGPSAEPDRQASCTLPSIRWTQETILSVARKKTGLKRFIGCLNVFYSHKKSVCRLFLSFWSFKQSGENKHDANYSFAREISGNFKKETKSF